MQDTLDRLYQQLDTLDGLIASAAARCPELSGWSVGQHIEHSLIALSGMSLALKKEHPGTGERPANAYRDLVLSTGSFPRGAVQAPEISRPSDNPDPSHLARVLAKTRSRLGNPLELAPTSTIIHPIMNVMYRDEVITFMAIHTGHHLTIIQDILNASA